MGLPEPILSPTESRARRSRGRSIAAVALLLITAPFVWSLPSLHARYNNQRPVTAPWGQQQGCDQAEALYPSLNTSALIDGQQERIINWLSGAVKVPTEVFDVMGEIGDDPRWDKFYDFADYLRTSFPLVHQHLSLTHVHTHALVYEWKGADKKLKPILLTAHQDVVPVLEDTRPLWDHDPYGGEVIGDRIWGRGSTDDKSGLIGSMAAVELLLESGKFTPERTVILGLGYDEEAAGKGAGYINDWLVEKYGPDSMSILIDEGNVIAPVYGQMFALPAVAEKGYLDAEVRVETPGGHSSVPPAHTGIGLLALAVAELEKHPHPLELGANSPLVDFVACAARYSPAPNELKKDIGKVISSRKGKVDNKALNKIKKWWDSKGSVEAGFYPPGLGRALISTTQAVDIISGGVKVNALPEVVTAVVNHRISIESTVKHVQDRMTRTLEPIAKAYNLELEAWGKKVHLGDGAKAGKLILDVAYNSTIETAPISPFTTESAAWRLLSGTIKGTWATRPNAKGDEIYMAPLMSTGNTDTKNYWDLTKNIYRFAYLPYDGESNNVHTVNEFLKTDQIVEMTRWFINFIAIADQQRDL